MKLAGTGPRPKIGSFFGRKQVTRTGKQRAVYQERLANRQAVARLRQAYDKLYRQTKAEKVAPVSDPEKNKTVQENQP